MPRTPCAERKPWGGGAQGQEAGRDAAGRDAARSPRPPRKRWGAQRRCLLLLMVEVSGLDGT